MSRRARLRGITIIVAAFELLTLAACNAGPAQQTAAPSVAVAVPIPTGELSASDQCMLDNGFRIIAVHEGYPGSKPWYSWESDHPGLEGMAQMQECQKLAPPARQKTDEELREIYGRWVQERACLVDMGYAPVTPPSFEKFASDWRSTGPWMPIDGIDYSSWTDSQYREAKERCTLEMFDR